MRAPIPAEIARWIAGSGLYSYGLNSGPVTLIEGIGVVPKFGIPALLLAHGCVRWHEGLHRSHRQCAGRSGYDDHQQKTHGMPELFDCGSA
jgi:hypothetical protein